MKTKSENKKRKQKKKAKKESKKHKTENIRKLNVKNQAMHL